MRQRVSLARTLASEPKILLMDEPFAALDEQTRLLLGDKVLQIQQQLKQTTLLITHNITEAVQMSDRILVMTYRPGKMKRIVDIDLPRPRTSEIVGSEAFGRYVAQIWNDLREEASRGMTRRGRARAASRGAGVMTDSCGTENAQASAICRRSRRAWRACHVLLVVELLIQTDVISRYIVPPPSEIIASFWRVVTQERVFSRFLLHRRRVSDRRRHDHRLRHRRRRVDAPLQAVAAGLRNLGRRHGLCARGADVSAVHGDLRSQRLDHHHDRLRRCIAAGHPEDDRGHCRHPQSAGQCRQQFQSDASQQFWKILFPPRCQPFSSACGSG